MKKPIILAQRLEDMKARAALMEGQCLSKIYINRITKLTWRCKKGHTWEATPGVIIQGSWCPVCSKSHKYHAPKYSIKDMNHWAAKKKGKCISLEYENIRHKLKWQCNKGHTWQAVPYTIRRGQWCPQCFIESRRLTIEEMQKIAKTHGGKCLSKKYFVSAKLKWKCEKGHVWEANPMGIKFGNSWCPVCAGSQKKNIEQVYLAASEKGVKCLSEKYINVFTKMKWQCKKGHRWSASFSNIRKRKHNWCPVCPKEYHTSPPLKYSLVDMQQWAAKKGGKCLSSEYKNIRTKLSWECKEKHVWQMAPTEIKKGVWCRKCYVPYNKLTIEEMQKIANVRGGRCLSEKYINGDIKLLWQCREGHKWRASWMVIKYQGSWCPVCRQKAKEKFRKKILIGK